MSNTYKGAVHCDASALIRVGGSNFANMRDVSELQALESSAPAFHRAVINGLKASGKVRMEDVMESATVIRDPKPKKRFGVGAKVRDRERGSKGIIIQASCGYTRKAHVPVHRISDRHGNSWLAKQSDLEVIY